MAYCNRCGRMIVWIKTANNKNMPCDPNPVRYLPAEDGAETVITRGGKTLRCVLAGEGDPTAGVGYIPHWGTCQKRRA